MKQLLIHLVVILTVAGTVLFTNLGTARLWDRDEPRNAGCAAEMMHRGDWIVPVFNDELRHQKPVLLYWLMMSAYSVLGVTEFAARCWSAILSLGTVLATYLIGRRLFSPSVAAVASIILVTSTMFVVAGRAATPDAALIFFGTLSILIYVLGTFNRKQKPGDAPLLRQDSSYFPKSWVVIVAMYGVMGIGVLAKGPVAAVLPTSIIGMFMLIQRLPEVNLESWQSRGWLIRVLYAIARPFAPLHFLKTCRAMKPLVAILTVLAVAAPWYVWVGLRTNGDWPRMFFLQEHFGRASTAFENHSGGLWYYPLAIILGFFPWSVLLVPTLIGVDRQVTRKHSWSTGYVLLLCWIGVQVGLFSLAKTKLPSYVTPCYPALALLTAAGLVRYAKGLTWVHQVWFRLSAATLTAAGVAIGIGLAIVGYIYLGGDLRPSAIGLIPVVAGGAAYWYAKSNQPARVVWSFAVGSVLLAIALFGFGTVFVDQHRTSHLLLEQIQKSTSGTRVATFRCLESSWVYYAGRPISELANHQAPPGVTSGDQHAIDEPTSLSPEQFAARYADCLVLTTDQHLDELQSRLPSDFQVLARADYFLRDKQILLLGRGKTQSVARTEETDQR